MTTLLPTNQGGVPPALPGLVHSSPTVWKLVFTCLSPKFNTNPGYFTTQSLPHACPPEMPRCLNEWVPYRPADRLVSTSKEGSEIRKMIWTSSSGRSHFPSTDDLAVLEEKCFVGFITPSWKAVLKRNTVCSHAQGSLNLFSLNIILSSQENRS